MIYLWSSHEEFKRHVSPVVSGDESLFNHFMIASWATSLEELLLAYNEVLDRLNELRRMGFHKKPSNNAKVPPPQVQEIVTILVASGEILLLLNKTLAMSGRAWDFIQAKELDEHLQLHLKENPRRANNELYKLYLAGEDLVKGFSELAKQGEDFLLNITSNFKTHKYLMSDFILARNLFSVGFDGVGAFVASRGLEGVLREVAKRKGLTLRLQNGKTLLGSEASFHDLIELCYRARWKKDNRRLINEEAKHLLHYLRTSRNYSAHPSSPAGDLPEIRNWRSVATLVTEAANSIWGDAQRKRARLISKEIPKEW